jgi:FtsP/CotA-like multicopper oxidase with cupredoxin domain
MNRKTLLRHAKRLALGLAALALAATPSFAQTTVDLAAVEGQWTPPGGGTPIAMWGFVTDPGSCPALPVAWGVGPTLTAASGDTLTINVRNCLSEPVSVFIPGQLKATSPVTFMDGQGRDRVRSFDAQTAAGGSGSYTWTGVKEGTYLYHSGTHPQVQVQMGLYGALTVGNYGVADEATLVYSEIDPALHAAVDDGTYGTTGPTSTFDYQPKYFLINGAAFPDTTDIIVGIGSDVLLRFVNAGLKVHVPTLEGGLYMDLIAEDGNPYPFPMSQYGVELPAGKTIDAVLNVGADGTYAIYDRALNLTNGAATGGGMLTYLVAGAVNGLIFSDGFESGDTSAWSLTVQ